MGILNVKISDELEQRVRDRYVRKKGDIKVVVKDALEHYMKCPEVKKKR